MTIVFLNLAHASGGSGCLGAPPKPYSCTCPITNQVEHYYGNEDLAAAFKNPSTCCYKAQHYVAPTIMLNPKIGDWVQQNGTWYKLVGVSAKSYRDTGEEIITTKTVLVIYNETNEYIEWHKMYDPPLDPILLGPCDSFVVESNDTVATPTPTIDLLVGNVSIIDIVKTINYILL